MRLLASADVHGRLAVYEWLLNAARLHDVGAILLAGDLFGCLDGFDTPEDAQRHEAKALIDLLKTGGVPVRACPSSRGSSGSSFECLSKRAVSISGRTSTRSIRITPRCSRWTRSTAWAAVFRRRSSAWLRPGPRSTGQNCRRSGTSCNPANRPSRSSLSGRP